MQGIALNPNLLHLLHQKRINPIKRKGRQEPLGDLLKMAPMIVRNNRW
jgi:hypothetical protein